MNRTNTHRGIVYAKNGGAGASQPLAVSAAIQILQAGGSFIDAGIALSAVISVVEPGASGLGGDLFLVTHHGATKENLAFNGSGEAPHAAEREAFGAEIDMHGYKAATVPGVVSGWFAAHQMYGKLPMAQILAPAIAYARDGFPANEGFIGRIKMHLQQFPDTQLFKSLGLSPDLALGEIVTNKDLAWVLEEIVKGGREAFYSGSIAQKITSGTDGWINADDLKSHSTRVSAPLSIKYRNFEVHGNPPPTQGMILMEQLLIANTFDKSTLSNADWLHMQVEAKKIAFTDRNSIISDPEFIPVDVQSILNPAHITSRAAGIDMAHADNKNLSPTEGSDTTYFLVADGEGNAVSWIQSVFHGFGASWVVPGTGMILNNRLTGFNLDPASPNFIVPGKRPAHTLQAFTVTNPDGSLKYVGGTPGANVQVQTNFQLITGLIDEGMSVQEVAEAPRWMHLSDPSMSAVNEEVKGVLALESRFGEDVIADLKSRGHEIKVLPPYGHASSVQVLEVLPSGSFAFGSDPRSDGHAAGI
jgi:gamma-glutamyltranspeptidase/glutathione hydrolase